jgi:hypothetical protein
MALVAGTGPEFKASILEAEIRRIMVSNWLQAENSQDPILIAGHGGTHLHP